MKHSCFYSLAFLLGALTFTVSAISAEERPASLLNSSKQAIATNAPKALKASHKKSQAKQKRGATKEEITIHGHEDEILNELQRPLDLSVPYADVDKSDRLNELDTDSSKQANIFAGDTRKKTRPVQIDGKLLMSPEPEVEKQKTADGAGIVINLKP